MSLKDEIIYCSYCHLPNHISSDTCVHCGKSLKKDKISMRVNRFLRYYLFSLISLYLIYYIAKPLLSPHMISLISPSFKILNIIVITLLFIDTFSDPNLWRVRIPKIIKRRYVNMSLVIFISTIIYWITHGSIKIEEKTYNLMEAFVKSISPPKRNSSKEKIKFYFPDNFEWVSS